MLPLQGLSLQTWLSDHGFRTILWIFSVRLFDLVHSFVLTEFFTEKSNYFTSRSNCLLEMAVMPDFSAPPQRIMAWASSGDDFFISAAAGIRGTHPGVYFCLTVAKAIEWLPDQLSALLGNLPQILKLRLCHIRKKHYQSQTQVSVWAGNRVDCGSIAWKSAFQS